MREVVDNLQSCACELHESLKPEHWQPLVDASQTAIARLAKPAPLDSTAEEVMVHVFMLRRRPENHFASSELRRFATQRSTRIVLNQISIAVLAANSTSWPWR